MLHTSICLTPSLPPSPIAFNSDRSLNSVSSLYHIHCDEPRSDHHYFSLRDQYWFRKVLDNLMSRQPDIIRGWCRMKSLTSKIRIHTLSKLQITQFQILLKLRSSNSVEKEISGPMTGIKEFCRTL